MRESARRGDPARLAAIVRFGIRPDNGIGLRVPQVRSVARRLGKDQDLAEELWGTGVHDARILASLVGDPQRITRSTGPGRVGTFLPEHEQPLQASVWHRLKRAALSGSRARKLGLDIGMRESPAESRKTSWSRWGFRGSFQVC